MAKAAGQQSDFGTMTLKNRNPRNKQPPVKHTKPVPSAAAGKRVTLARALSKLGFCSRTQGEELVRAGRVGLGGCIVTDLETWVDLDSAKITVDGKPVAAQSHVYLMLNKPRGLVTTRHDPEGRATVFDCLKDIDTPHISPVGRLDKASEGLLLFTNDTVFAQTMLDPETHLDKTYHVQIDRQPDEAMLERLRQGIMHDGEFLRARRVDVLRAGDKNAWLEIVLDEGRNRHIRRMLEALDIECLRLLRVAIGDVQLGDLPKGEVRPLTGDELARLKIKTKARVGG